MSVSVRHEWTILLVHQSQLELAGHPELVRGILTCGAMGVNIYLFAAKTKASCAALAGGLGLADLVCRTSTCLGAKTRASCAALTGEF